MKNHFVIMKCLEEKHNYKLNLIEKIILLKDWAIYNFGGKQ